MAAFSFYSDENMAMALEGLLRAEGHAVASTFEEGRSGALDPHQLLFAAERDWTLLPTTGAIIDSCTMPGTSGRTLGACPSAMPEFWCSSRLLASRSPSWQR